MSQPASRPPAKRAAPNPLTLAAIRVCPECAGPVVRSSGCIACAHCGWGRCG